MHIFLLVSAVHPGWKIVHTNNINYNTDYKKMVLSRSNSSEWQISLHIHNDGGTQRLWDHFHNDLMKIS